MEVEFNRAPRAGILFDVDTGEVLWELNPGRRLPIASLTKMMTGLDDRRAPPALGEGADHSGGARVRGIGRRGAARRPRGEAETMLNGLLLVSGNDAAIALAQHVTPGLCRSSRG